MKLRLMGMVFVHVFRTPGCRFNRPGVCILSSFTIAASRHVVVPRSRPANPLSRFSRASLAVAAVQVDPFARLARCPSVTC